MVRSWLRQRKELKRQRLLAALAERDDSYGLGLMRSTKLGANSLYPLLDQLIDEGLVQKHMEEDPGDRPPRTLYHLARTHV